MTELHNNFIMPISFLNINPIIGMSKFILFTMIGGKNKLYALSDLI